MADDDVQDLDVFHSDSMELLKDDLVNESKKPTTSKTTTTKTKRRQQVRPKVASEWTDYEMFKLIECVEGLPVLWNAKHSKYRNKIDRQAAWKDMVFDVFDEKFSAAEIMAKWSNMRIQYRSYDAKIRKTKSGQGAMDVVKWKFFNAMEFVDRAEASQSAATVSNLVYYVCLLMGMISYVFIWFLGVFPSF